MASTANPGILTETSATLLNYDTGNSPSTRKRKRDNGGELHVVQPFTIKVSTSPEDLNFHVANKLLLQPHPSSKFDKPLSLIPLFSIPRNSLALSFLDAGDDSLSTGQGRLFSATRTVLDATLEAAGGQLVLIARLITNGKLYAVERVEAGIYALCRLGNWVAEENIRALQRQSTTSPSQSQSIPPSQLPAGGGVLQWWHWTKIETKDVHPEAKLDGQRPKTKGLLKICANDATENRRPMASSDISGELMRHARDINTISEAPNPVVELVDTSFSKQTPQDVFEKVRQQYLETLYTSKVCKPCPETDDPTLTSIVVCCVFC
jgi:DNA replication regulator SLD3